MDTSFISNYLENSSSDEHFMALAVQEALKGEGFVRPNPLVGAVIVKDKKILATGFHKKYGELHAERDALKNAKEKGVSVQGATIYVTLEPCCHTGKQPPCTEAIIQSGIKRVVTGSSDPNPLVNGKGIKQLEENGIQVTQGVLKNECDSINKIFFHYIKTKMPYVILKYACSADGKTALPSGKQAWLSGNLSRQNVHLTRAYVKAVLTGVSTVIKDDPLLTARLDDGIKHFQPDHIVADSHLSIPPEANLVKMAKDFPLTVVCTKNLSEDQAQKKEALIKKGVKIIQTDSTKEGRVNIRQMLELLAQDGTDSILVESGGTLASSFLLPPLVQKIQCYVCPLIIGQSSYTPVRGAEGLENGIKNIGEALKLTKPRVSFFESDVLLEYELKEENQCSQE